MRFIYLIATIGLVMIGQGACLAQETQCPVIVRQLKNMLNDSVTFHKPASGNNLRTDEVQDLGRNLNKISRGGLGEISKTTALKVDSIIKANHQCLIGLPSKEFINDLWDGRLIIHNDEGTVVYSTTLVYLIKNHARNEPGSMEYRLWFESKDGIISKFEFNECQTFIDID